MFEDYVDENNETYLSDCPQIFYYETSYLDELKKRQDIFLDSYSYYLKNKTSYAKNILERKTIELEIIDPTFDFRIDQLNMRQQRMKQLMKKIKKISRMPQWKHYFVVTPKDIYTGYINKEMHNSFYKINKLQKDL